MKNYNFLKNIVAVLLLQGGNYIIPLLSFPYLTRTLGVDNYGMYGLAMTMSQYLMLVIDFGFGLSASRKVAINKDDKEKLSEIITSTFTIKLIIALFLIIMIFLYYMIVGGIYSHIGLILTLQIISSVFNLNWFYQGIEKIRVFVWFTFFSKIISLVLIFLYVNGNEDFLVAILLQCVSTFLLAVLCIYYLIVFINKSQVKLSIPNAKDIISTFHDTKHYFMANIAVSMYTASTPIILGVLANTTSVGIFTSSDRIKGAVLGFFMVLSGVIYPKVSYLFNKNKSKGFLFFKKVYLIETSLTLILSILLFFYAKELCNYIMGPEFSAHYHVLQMLSIVLFLSMQSVMMSNYLLLPLGYKTLYSKLPIFISIVHLCICPLAVKYYGVLGATYAIVFLEFIVCLVYIYYIYTRGIFFNIIKS